MIAHAHIIEELPSVMSYRWFVTCNPLPMHDPRRRLFRDRECEHCGRYYAPRFDKLEDAKIWCAANGLHWRVLPHEPEG